VRIKKSLYLTATFFLLLIISTYYLNGFFFTLPTLYADEIINGQTEVLSTSFTNDTTNLNGFSIQNETNFYFTSTTNHNMVVWNENEALTVGSLGGNPENFGSPTHISVLPNGSIFIYDSLFKRLKLLNSNYEFLANFNILYNNQTPVGTIDNIGSMSTDLKNNLYALNYDDNNNYILKYSEEQLSIILNASTLNITFTENSKIITSPNGEYIFLSNVNNGTNLYYLHNLSNLTQIDTTSYGISNISEIAIDCANNLFILDKNATDSKLHKLNRNSYSYYGYLRLPFNGLNKYSNLKINVETGTIFAINNETNTLETISSTNEQLIFTENISSFIHPLNLNELVALEESITLAKILEENTAIFQTPYNITPMLILNENEYVVILSNSVNDNPDYAYVLYVNDISGENKTGYILKTLLQEEVLLESEYSKVRILNNNTNFYKYPTTLTTEESQIVVGTANKNDVFTVLNEVNSLTDANENSFYAIQTSDNKIVYVRKIDVVPEEITVIVPTLFTNAEIIITDTNDFITVYSNLQTLAPLTDVLEEGKRVYITVYDANNQYTQVTFLNENNEEITGYVLTKYIKVYGDYNNLLQALLLSSFSIILVVILIVIKTKKREEE